MQRTAIFPGSFDPFTRGHKALVDESLHLFDKVVIAIGENVAKNSLLSLTQRRRLIETVYAGEARIEVVTYNCLTVELARRHGSQAIIRGVRNTVDFEYEKMMEQTNRLLDSGVTTMLLMTPPPLIHISSSTVRELLQFGRAVDELMPEGIDIKDFIDK